MCEFKYCKSKGKCFLADVSPCPGMRNKKNDTPLLQSKHSVMRSLNMSYDGFLEPDPLIDALADAEVPAQVA